MDVKLIAKTQICNQELLNKIKNSSPEQLIMYCARASNPKNQTSGNPALLHYCSSQGHWSIFQMANMVVEINTSRAIAQQILRHRSFSFQEFSQRYKEVTALDEPFIIYQARSQDSKNRQNSLDNVDEEDCSWFESAQIDIQNMSLEKYQEALDRGIAKEQARFLLPLNTKTKLYMNGDIRSWIHYLNLRCGNGTQKEHQDIANQIKHIFIREFLEISKALKWT